MGQQVSSEPKPRSYGQADWGSGRPGVGRGLYTYGDGIPNTHHVGQGRPGTMGGNGIGRVLGGSGTPTTSLGAVSNAASAPMPYLGDMNRMVARLGLSGGQNPWTGAAFEGGSAYTGNLGLDGLHNPWTGAVLSVSGPGQNEDMTNGQKRGRPPSDTVEEQSEIDQMSDEEIVAMFENIAEDYIRRQGLEWTRDSPRWSHRYWEVRESCIKKMKAEWEVSAAI